MENQSICHSSLHSLLLSLLRTHPHHPPFLLCLLLSSNISSLPTPSSLPLHSSSISPSPPIAFKNNKSSVFPFSSLSSFLFESLSSKSLYFIRHAESTYNSWRSSSCFNIPCFYKNSIENHDPSLTLKGIQQVKAASQKLYENEEGKGETEMKQGKKEKEKGGKKENDKKGDTEGMNKGGKGKKERKILFDVTYVSPLTRALQTCELLGEIEEKVIVTDLLRERLDFACDIGKEKNQLEINFKKFDFTYVDKGSWWLEKQEEVEWKTAQQNQKERGGKQKDEAEREKRGKRNEEDGEKKKKKKAEGYKKEEKTNVMGRVLLMLIWALSSKEEKILFVSHSNIYKIMFGCDIFDRKIKNAEIVKFEKEHLVKFLKKIEPLFQFKDKKTN